MLPTLPDVSCSVAASSMFAIGSALTYLLFVQERAHDEFHQAFSHISIVKEKYWGEKAWLGTQGYRVYLKKLC